MRLAVPLLCLIAPLLAGCANERTVAGAFRLELSEDGTTYYLHKRGHDDSKDGGSIIGAAVVRIGWSSGHILAQRHSIYRGDPDGWMVIDVQTEKITGPFSDAELQVHPEALGIATFPVNEAWRRL